MGVVIVLAVLSSLIKDNYFFRWSSSLTVGFAIAYGLIGRIQYLQSSLIVPLVTKGQYILLIPLILGFLAYSRLSKKYAWLSRYALSLMLGIGMGVTIVGMLRAQIIDQVGYTISDIVGSTTPLGYFNGILILIGTASTIAYFLFTREQKGAFGTFTRVGRVFMMVSIAIVFGGDYILWMASLIAALRLIINSLLRGVLGLPF